MTMHISFFLFVKLSAQNFQLVRFGTVRPNCVVLRLAGPPGSGKSTIGETLCTGYWAGFFRWERQVDTSAANSEKRTKGMRCVKFINGKSSEFMIMDLGGHDEFYASHQTLMSFEDTPAINGIVLSTLMEAEEMQREAMKWGSFYACRVRPDSPQQPLIFILTRQDKATLQQKKNAMDAFLQVKDTYNSYFDFPYEPLFLDARKSWNKPMKDMRRKLSQLRTKVLGVRMNNEPNLSFSPPFVGRSLCVHYYVYIAMCTSLFVYYYV